MHQSPAPKMTVYLLICIIGLLVSNLNSAHAQQDDDQAIESEIRAETTQAADDLWVEVEPSNIISVDLTGGYHLVPYKIRRHQWSQVYGVAYSTYAPLNHTSEFGEVTVEDAYGSSFSSLEISVVVKNNVSWGSWGIDIGVGSSSASSKGDYSGLELSLTPIHLGGILSLDTLFFEPYVVPYASLGLYTVLYKESITADNSVSGNTQIAPYAAAGVLLQTDWLDQAAARESYQEAGIENTFIFVEARQFFKAQDPQDPDFSSLHANTGLKLEF